MSKMINYPIIASQVFNTPLYATPDLASSIKSFLLPKLTGSQTADIEMGSKDEAGNRVSFNLVGNLAIIPVHGALMSRRGSMDAACMEIESYDRVTSRISEALDNNQVEAIVLDFQSGGGMAIGCKEAADFIFAAKDEKPIYAIANFVSGSAAYFMMSACTKIYASQTSIVGSIGVIWEHADYSGALEQQGVKITTLYRGDNKNDCTPYEGLTEQAALDVNERLDDAYELFTSSVAQYRGLSIEQVIATQARVYQGQRAIDVGLADELMTPQQAINQISQLHPVVAVQTQSIGNRAKSIGMNSKL